MNHIKQSTYIHILAVFSQTLFLQVLHSHHLNEKTTELLDNLQTRKRSGHCTLRLRCRLRRNIDNAKRSEVELCPTDVAAYWIPPSKVGQPSSLKNIKFDVHKENIEPSTIICKRKHIDSVPPLSKEEVCDVIKKFKAETEKGSVLETVVQPFAKELKELLAASPAKLTSLYKSEYEKLDLNYLKGIGMYNKLNSLFIKLLWHFFLYRETPGFISTI